MDISKRRIEEVSSHIGQIRLESSRESILPDESVNLTLSFKLLGRVRDAFVQSAWEEAHNQHDNVMRVTYFLSLHRILAKLVRKKAVEPLRLARTAKFYWSRNPELPHRIWVMIINEEKIPRLPNNEEEAKRLLFDVSKTFTLLGTDLGKGRYSISGTIKAKWGKHTFTDRGTVQSFSEPIRIECRYP